MDRRALLKMVSVAPLVAAVPRLAWTESQLADAKADYTLRIGTGLVELSPTYIISTTLYNDQFPGPLLRFKEGQQVVVDVHNDTDTPELVHWHGQLVPSDVDGASEEGTPFVPAHSMRRIAFVPRPAGFRFYHTHVFAGADLNQGTYTGQVGPVYIEPQSDPGAYDREVFLILKEFGPSWSRGGDMSMDMLVGAPNAALQQMGKAADEKAKGTPKGFEIGYELFSINGRMRGHGEPIRVKYGERVLFHVLNASATEIRSLALPGHVFRVVALDGNPVPTPANVPVLWLGTAERVSAIVEMKHPGVWTMGDLSDDDRRHGMGIVVEYSSRKGAAQWVKAAAVPMGLCAVRPRWRDGCFTRRDHRDHHSQAECRRARLQRLDLERRSVLAGGNEADIHPTAGTTLSPEVSQRQRRYPSPAASLTLPKRSASRKTRSR
jgi:FtsP/CotA-like multicopper oxidase with cupredoxin domain